ncbi:MAG: hypothetical protein AB1546_02180, partial [bacterium]
MSKRVSRTSQNELIFGFVSFFLLIFAGLNIFNDIFITHFKLTPPSFILYSIIISLVLCFIAALVRHSLALLQESLIEFSLYPVFIVIPYFVFHEYFMNFQKTQHPLYSMLYAVLSAVIIIYALLAAGFRDPRSPLSLPGLVLLIQTLFFGTFFVIFRSLESFRIPQQTLFQIAVFFILFIFLITGAVRSRWTFRIVPFILLPAALIIGESALTLLWTPNFFVSLKEIILLSSIILFFFLLIQYFHTLKHLHLLVAAALITATIEGAIGIWQHFGLNALLGLGQNFDPFSTLGNKNYVAEVMAMLLPFSLASFFYFRESFLKALCLVNIAVMLTVVIINNN